jgi:hypothetical protein
MTATMSFPIEARRSDTLEALLAPIHDRWIEQVGRVLAPAIVPRANFWERWGAVRYLIDQFEDRFRLECALVDSLAAGLSRTAIVRLGIIRARLERTRTNLIALGRRRGTAFVVSAFAQEIFEQAKLWCAELEFATKDLGLEDLSSSSQDMLDHLKTVARLDL